MTDSDIIKALECCSDSRSDCSKCPCFGAETKEKITCEIKMIKNALDLINRFNNRIELLEMEKQALRKSQEASAENAMDVIHNQDAEIKMLQAVLKNEQDAVRMWHRQAELNADSIIKLQAEIEGYKHEHIQIDDFARNICKERLLQGKAVADFDSLRKYVESQKTEAIKDFAKKLKAISREHSETNARIVYERQIDDLVKKKVGESE